MKYFRLFACCIPVKGAVRSIICDLQRNTYCDIPISLYQILTVHKDDSFEELVEIYEDEETLGEYFQFLKVNEFGFWTTHPEWFPELERSESPAELY